MRTYLRHISVNLALAVISFMLGGTTIVFAASSGVLKIDAFNLADGANPSQLASVDAGGNVAVRVRNDASQPVPTHEQGEMTQILLERDLSSFETATVDVSQYNEVRVGWHYSWPGPFPVCLDSGSLAVTGITAANSSYPLESIVGVNVCELNGSGAFTTPGVQLQLAWASSAGGTVRFVVLGRRN